MRKKIIGVTVGSPLPKPNLKQTDPKKGDYVRGKDVIPTKVSDLENDSGFLTEHQDLSGYAKCEEIPTKADQVGADPKGAAENTVSQHNTNTEAHNDIRLELKAINDRLTVFFDSDDKTLDELSEIVAYITNNKTLIESITTNKVGVSDIIDNLATNVKNKPLSAAQGVVLKGLIDTLSGSLSNYQPKGEYALTSEIPKKVSGLENDSKFITVSGAPVQSVNGKTGVVTLDAAAVKARPDTWMPTHSDVGAEKSGTAASEVGKHNTNTDAHNDIRLLVASLATRLDALANSDDETLDQMAEVVAYIKSNRNLIEQITTGKVSVSDIVNNLSTNVTDKPLSAAQGVALKALIDAIQVPTKLGELINDKGYITGYTETDPTVPEWAKAASKPSYTASEVGALPSTTKIPTKTSDLTNDSGFITDYTETDPTVPSWAKASSKPSYTKSEVGLSNVENVKQYSASNPPPYPVTSVNGKTGAVTVNVPTVPTKVSAFTNDAGYITNYTETDPTVPSWAKATSKPSYTASEVGAVPTSRTVNGKALSGNITLSASDVGARASTWTPSSADIQSALGYIPANQANSITITGKDADGNIHTFNVFGWEGGADAPT